jgi:sigma-B regulation protein RsbU (phosphoserine phosphatase)
VLKYRSTLFACGYFVAVLLADLLTSPQHSFTSLFALVPVLLALDWGPVVVAMGSAPLLVLTVTNTFGKDQSSTTGTAIRSIGVVVGVGIGSYIAAYREHHASALSFSRAAALAAQDAILPIVPASIGPFRFTCAYRSAADESLIGGDFYKVINTDFGARLIVGDVRGKGLGAIAMVSAVLGCFREWAPETTSLKDLVSRLDARVVDKGSQADFVTAVVATLDEALGVEVANCGHPSPIHFTHGRPKGGVIPEHRTTPLGLSPNPALTVVPWSPGDRLLFYTDGLIECRDRDGTWIELDRAMLATLGSDPFEEALPGLIARVEARCGELTDDVALLLVEYMPS